MTMTAYLVKVKARTIRTVQIDPSTSYEQIRGFIGCDRIDMVRIDRDHCIVVDDDGKGLSPEERAQVSRRGKRLDESKPGSGLGLSIVVDLAALYGGSLTLDAAPLGGLRAELTLPSA